MYVSGMTGQNETPSRIALWEGVHFIFREETGGPKFLYFIYIIQPFPRFVNTFSEKIPQILTILENHDIINMLPVLDVRFDIGTERRVRSWISCPL